MQVAGLTYAIRYQKDKDPASWRKITIQKVLVGYLTEDSDKKQRHEKNKRFIRQDI